MKVRQGKGKQDKEKELPAYLRLETEEELVAWLRSRPVDLRLGRFEPSPEEMAHPTGVFCGHPSTPWVGRHPYGPEVEREQLEARARAAAERAAKKRRREPAS